MRDASGRPFPAPPRGAARPIGWRTLQGWPVLPHFQRPPSIPDTDDARTGGCRTEPCARDSVQHDHFTCRPPRPPSANRARRADARDRDVACSLFQPRERCRRREGLLCLDGERPGPMGRTARRTRQWCRHERFIESALSRRRGRRDTRAHSCVLCVSRARNGVDGRMEQALGQRCREREAACITLDPMWSRRRPVRRDIERLDHHRVDLRGLERELVRRGLCRPAFGIKLKAASASRSATERDAPVLRGTVSACGEETW